MKPIRTALALALAAALALSACSAGTPTQSEAEAAVCAAIQTWSDQMRALTSVDAGSATADDVKALRSKVQEAWTDVKEALADVASADKAAVLAAAETLETALKNIPDGVPVADIVANLKIAAVPLKAVYVQMANGLGCRIATPY